MRCRDTGRKCTHQCQSRSGRPSSPPGIRKHRNPVRCTRAGHTGSSTGHHYRLVLATLGGVAVQQFAVYSLDSFLQRTSPDKARREAPPARCVADSCRSPPYGQYTVLRSCKCRCNRCRRDHLFWVVQCIHIDREARSPRRIRPSLSLETESRTQNDLMTRSATFPYT